MAAQAMQDKDKALRDFYLNQPKTLEINPHHPLISGMLNHVEQKDALDRDPELVRILHEMTMIRSGYDLKDSVEFASRVERVLRTNLGVDLEAKAEVVVKPAPDTEDPIPERKNQTPEEFENDWERIEKAVRDARTDPETGEVDEEAVQQVLQKMKAERELEANKVDTAEAIPESVNEQEKAEEPVNDSHDEL